MKRLRLYRLIIDKFQRTCFHCTRHLFSNMLNYDVQKLFLYSFFFICNIWNGYISTADECLIIICLVNQ